jgi:hypothetical protein
MALGAEMKRAIPLAALGVVLGCGAIGWSTRGLPVQIVVGDGHAVAHMELLGEYPNDVKSVELRRTDTSQIIWRIVARKEWFSCTTFGSP